MSTNNRIGRNPFDKKPKASPQASQASSDTTLRSSPANKAGVSTKVAKAKKSAKAAETAQTELNLRTTQENPAVNAVVTTASEESILKVSDKKAEEQIVGELIHLPEESWQPLSMVPAQFIKQLFLSWL